jgi:hypothetical protein
MTRIMGTLHAHHYALLIIASSVLLRMPTVSDKTGRENHNMHLMFNNFHSKIVLFAKRCGKILQKWSGHR